MNGKRPPKLHTTRPESVLNLLPSAFGLPSASWWADAQLTREQFAARVAQEQPRILGSKFARLSSIVRIEAGAE